jgi:hypothetical protein
MNACRTAALLQLTHSPLCGLKITQHKNMPRVRIAIYNLLKIKPEKSSPTKLLKTKANFKKDVKNEDCSQ